MVADVVDHEALGRQVHDLPSAQPHTPAACLFGTRFNEPLLAMQVRALRAVHVHLATWSQLLRRGGGVEELLDSRVHAVLHQLQHDAAPEPVAGHVLSPALQLEKDELHIGRMEHRERSQDHPVGLLVADRPQHAVVQLLQECQLGCSGIGEVLECLLYGVGTLGVLRQSHNLAAELLQCPLPAVTAGLELLFEPLDLRRQAFDLRSLVGEQRRSARAAHRELARAVRRLFPKLQVEPLVILHGPELLERQPGFLLVHIKHGRRRHDPEAEAIVVAPAIHRLIGSPGLLVRSRIPSLSATAHHR
mmetsp:Transcript_107682/g.300032  ORF Transcript_107682/g.300032 Transcript_107682/m.300032 type:complete len:304 (+) Transcript_107682:522-1433(+)